MDWGFFADVFVLAMRILSLTCLGAGAAIAIAEVLPVSGPDRLAAVPQGKPEVPLIRIEMSRVFPVRVDEAFAYITDMRRWQDYWPDFVRVQDPANARWGQPGDTATIVLRLLNRERALNMKLEEFRKDALVAYFSRQRGLPDVRHERHFKAVPGGFEYRLVVAFEPRRGVTGAFDRLLLRRAIAGALRKTMANLGQVLLHAHVKGLPPRSSGHYRCSTDRFEG